MIRMKLKLYRGILGAQLTHNRKVMRFSLGVRIPAQYWDSKTATLKYTCPGYKELNEVIIAKSNEFLKMIEDIYKEGDLSYEAVKRKRNQTTESFFDTYRSFINNLPVPRNSTRRKMFATLNRLVGYEKKFGLKLTGLYFRPEGFGHFLRYLQYDLDLKDSTVHKHVKEVKRFIQYLVKGMDVSHMSYSPGPNSVVYLTEEELVYIWEADLPGTFEVYRDWIIFLSYTGMRYGDALDANESWIDPKTKRWDYIQQKTFGHAHLPCTTKPELILAKYEGRMPQISNQALNRGLKALFTRLGITRLVEKSYSMQGRHIRELVPLNEEISTHVGRKTFIMNALLNGVPRDHIKLMTGHKTDTEISAYIRLTKKDIEPFRFHIDFGNSSIK